MGELILCTYPVASKPFRVNEKHINIYTMEELCYYLEESLTILEESFFSEELCDWISGEMEAPDMADELWRLIRDKAPLAERVRLIFRMSRCFLPREMERMEELLESMKGKNLPERKKIRIDDHLKRKAYRTCIREYEKLLESSDTEAMPDSFRGSLYHNLGVSYAGMYLFSQAADCFAKAFRLGAGEESRACYYHALQLVPADQPVSGDEPEADFETLVRYKDEFGRAEEEAAARAHGQLSRFSPEEKTSLEKQEILFTLLEDWKKKYRQM